MTFICPVSDKASQWVTIAVAARVLQVPEESVHRWAQKGFLLKRSFYDLVSRRDVVDLAAKLVHVHTGGPHPGEPADEEVKRLTGGDRRHGPSDRGCVG
jgi:hypothetical protein